MNERNTNLAVDLRVQMRDWHTGAARY